VITGVVVYSGGRHWGGIETYLSNLFRLYDRQRMRLVLVSLGRWELATELERQGMAGDLRILSAKRMSLGSVRSIRRIAREECAGLVVSQGVVANAYARLATRSAGIPNLTVVHSDLKLDYPRALKRYAYQLSDRLLRPATKSYVAVSGHLKDQLLRSGVEPGRVRVVYNGVDTAAGRRVGARDAGDSTSADERDLDPPPLSGEGARLVSVGRLHRVKNFDSLVKAMRLLPDNVTLTVYGEGEERPELERSVRELGLHGRVLFPGESGNMRQALQGADLYIQSSWSEGCSFAVAEAMLQGKPTVVTPRGGLPEQVRDRVTGLVTEDGSPGALATAVGVLLDDHDLANRLGRAGKKAAEAMYSMEKWLNDTTTAFCDAAVEVECGP